MMWDHFMEKWMRNYVLAKEYYLKNGHLRMTTNYITEEGTKLGMWLSTQRQAYRGNPNYNMTEEKQGLLEAIEIDWTIKIRRRSRSTM